MNYSQWNESELDNNELKNYKVKAAYYIRQHKDKSIFDNYRCYSTRRDTMA